MYFFICKTGNLKPNAPFPGIMWLWNTVGQKGYLFKVGIKTHPWNTENGTNCEEHL